MAAANADAACMAAADAGLTPYEAMIAENIRRNRAVMEALGLFSSDACRHEELRAAKKGKGGGRPKGLAEGGGEEQRAAVRRSQRLAGWGAPDPEVAAGGKRKHASAETDEHMAQREDHLRWAGNQLGVPVVGTASYEHTLHRVLSMSTQALATRIATIERACGQHAVSKMRLFASVLALEGHISLAEDAAAAHKRLVEKLGLPASDGEEVEVGGKAPATDNAAVKRLKGSVKSG
ncbi:hypothetical protein T492DRAFT_1065738 [Pavlovales sp. CCMP2436]|nr:hypothetical protein T492DRAFT_1065738 [Pavlovales sp. CCMP2436]|mmetsp:Transcript_42796/g.106175  ORF Transcript_42796/g.106175 Transcript_42796/m.106175 type:complete len:235 (+) Transcript_42796:44-748(+)